MIFVITNTHSHLLESILHFSRRRPVEQVGKQIDNQCKRNGHSDYVYTLMCDHEYGFVYIYDGQLGDE